MSTTLENPDGQEPAQAGDIALGDDGRIRLRATDHPHLFVFAYRGVDFEARMETATAARVALSAELGRLPYSMEAREGRRLTRRIVEATGDLPGGRIKVTDDQNMYLVASAQPPLPVTPASIMAAITSLLLDFRPYIDLLRESLILPAAQPAAANSPPE